jgi:hypothetical protein
MVSHGKPVGTADRRNGPLGAAGHGVLAAIAGGAVIVLTACGSTPAGGAGQPASAGAGHSTRAAGGASASAGALCANTQKVDRVVASPTTSHLREVLPRGVTITDASRVRALAAALCALPRVPAGVQCPADFGGVSQLVFAAGGREFHAVRIRLSGCRFVTGAGPTRSWSRSPGFGQLLTRTVGGKGRMISGAHPSSVPTP